MQLWWQSCWNTLLQLSLSASLLCVDPHLLCIHPGRVSAFIEQVQRRSTEAAILISTTVCVLGFFHRRWIVDVCERGRVGDNSHMQLTKESGPSREAVADRERDCPHLLTPPGSGLGQQQWWPSSCGTSPIPPTADHHLQSPLDPGSP